MNNFNQIQKKLYSFIKKYYTNEIIKGSILFLSFGLLYFIFTLFIEYFLWLKPVFRTILFWIFILVEFSLLVKLIVIPILKLIGLQKGISLSEASKIIGLHFKEVDDKLLNVLQLNESNTQTDLLIASIEQKAEKLQPIPFKKAINFNTNTKYIKYLIIPAFIWLIVFFTGNNSIFTQSFDRVVHHKIAYLPPAPFSFSILNKNLKAIEGKAFILQVSTIGNTTPENVKIHFNNESYYLNNKSVGTFFYEFEYPNNSMEFYLEANGVESIPYNLKVVKTPKIIDFKMALNYPNYTRKKDEIIKNTGNAIVPEGTNITWKISSQNTNEISFISLINNKEHSIWSLDNSEKGKYKTSKNIRQNIDYQITTSNKNLKNFEKLNYQLQVVKDEFPKIFVNSDIDSVSRGPVQFIGRLSDDYGLSKLQVVAKNLSDNSYKKYSILINTSDFEEFYYVFPQGIVLDEGTSYEIHFEVFDNDGVNGSKKVISQMFYYKNKTKQEINEELLLEQKQSLEDIKNSTKSSKDYQKSLEDFTNKLKSKNNTDWNDKKQINEFLKQQEKYQQLLKRNTEKLLKNLDEMDDETDPSLKDKKEELKKRIEETKELQKKEDLLKELQELVEKLKKENLLDKLDKLTKQTKQENKSLERILELTKRFYVEKKAAQIMRKIEELAMDQDKLSENKENSSEKQNELNKKFDSIQKDFNDLNKQNKELKSPMEFPDTKADQKLIEMEMQKAEKNLEDNKNDSKKVSSNKKEKAKKNQKSAAKKMEELSKNMEENMMQMEMDMSEENIKDLQQILNNLIIFSFDQENLMLSFEGINSKNAEYPKKLKKQQVLKEYFEHIDDSLYTLSLRMVRLSSKIQKDLTDAHYNLDKSLENIAENKIHQGVSNQQYTMTAANNLADLLSDILQSLQNKKPGKGKGKGKKGEEISLPDIIKKQSDLIQKLKEGVKPGQTKDGKGKEQMSGEQYEIYQQQNQLREQLRSLLKKESNKGSGGNDALQKMEELENMLLKKGFTKEVLQNMQKLMHELLKLEEATFEQNKDKKRQADVNIKDYNPRVIKAIQTKQLYFNQNEILIKQNLPLQPVYQKRVKEYFKQN